MQNIRDDARKALASAYVGDAGKGSQIILAHSNKDVRALNEAVRDVRQGRGELGGAVRFQTERGGRELAVGDRIVFLRNDRDLGVKNGTLGTVERADHAGLSVKLDTGEIRMVDVAKYAAVDHGYAVTIHKAQGVTVDQAYLLATPGMDRSLAYVGMTRHRENATLFAGVEDFGGKDEADARERLARTLSRERRKESTLDFADRRGFDGERVVHRRIERGQIKLDELAKRAERTIGRLLESAGQDGSVLTMMAAGKTGLRVSAPPAAASKRKASEIAAENAKAKAARVAAAKAANALSTTGEVDRGRRDEAALLKLLEQRSAERRSRAVAVTARLEKLDEALTHAYRTHQAARPQEPRGLAAMLGRGPYEKDAAAWQRQEQRLARRIGDLQRRRRIAGNIARGPMDAQRLAARKVQREQPELWQRVETFRTAQQAERAKAIREQTQQQFAQRDRGQHRGPSR